MANITYHCAASGCNCKVANDDNNVKTELGLFCCQTCAEGQGCSHVGCACAEKEKS